jgi:hypothetical protein
VRINESTKHPGKCLVSVAEREPVSADKFSGGQPPIRTPNYFSVDPAGVENALVNEFFAPFQGLEKVREAHGNWAAAELAHEVCSEINQRIGKTRINSLDPSEEESVNATPPDANLESPYFAHLAMCKDAPVQPPLGWVLSDWTQRHFGDLLQACGNDKQLLQLENALGMPAPHRDVAQQTPAGQ